MGGIAIALHLERTKGLFDLAQVVFCQLNGSRADVYGNEPIPREMVLACVSALDEYLRSGTANLFEYRSWSFGTTTRLGAPNGQLNAEVIRTLRALGDDACVLPDVLVRVPMQAAQELRGRNPEPQNSLGRSAPPLCAGFEP